jgi:poly(3-hydroxybutyrate) depolymerase
LPLYHFYEMNHAAIAPARAISDLTRLAFRNPLNPISHTPLGRSVAAACELFERTTRRYSKPEFGITKVQVGGEMVPVKEQVAWARPFCELLHFQREMPRNHRGDDTKVLIVAPLSGHYATLLRGTVAAMLERHDVYVTDWADARMVPLVQGKFDLDDYINYLIDMFAIFRGDIHVMAVCQPSVPVLAAVSIMEANRDPNAPHSMTLMGGPIDTRENPTEVNNLAESRSIDWFRSNVITPVPWPHPGAMRAVYPGFLQLTGFMQMNLDRHLDAHTDLFRHLVEGDGDSADKHRDFYDEYLAVMDLDAAFYLQTVETVFINHALPKGEMRHRGTLVDPSKIKRTALMTVEGEKDDISGVGQTKAAHKLCSSLPDTKRVHYLQNGVGHYGVFNGSRFRAEIAPRISDFMFSNHNTGIVSRAVRSVRRKAKAESAAAG